MKEADAKLKWCPMARPCGDYEDEYGNNRNKFGQPQMGALCIGSDCMMWAEDSETNKYASDGFGSCGLKTKQGAA